MIGHIGTVHDAFSERGRVDIDGESWIADTHEPLASGQKVRVTAINKLVLKVEPVDNTVKE